MIDGHNTSFATYDPYQGAGSDGESSANGVSAMPLVASAVASAASCLLPIIVPHILETLHNIRVSLGWAEAEAAHKEVTVIGSALLGNDKRFLALLDKFLNTPTDNKEQRYLFVDDKSMALLKAYAPSNNSDNYLTELNKRHVVVMNAKTFVQRMCACYPKLAKNMRAIYYQLIHRTINVEGNDLPAFSMASLKDFIQALFNASKHQIKVFHDLDVVRNRPVSPKILGQLPIRAHLKLAWSQFNLPFFDFLGIVLTSVNPGSASPGRIEIIKQWQQDFLPYIQKDPLLGPNLEQLMGTTGQQHQYARTYNKFADIFFNTISVTKGKKLRKFLTQIINTDTSHLTDPTLMALIGDIVYFYNTQIADVYNLDKVKYEPIIDVEMTAVSGQAVATKIYDIAKIIDAMMAILHEIEQERDFATEDMNHYRQFIQYATNAMGEPGFHGILTSVMRNDKTIDWDEVFKGANNTRTPFAMALPDVGSKSLTLTWLKNGVRGPFIELPVLRTLADFLFNPEVDTLLGFVQRKYPDLTFDRSKIALCPENEGCSFVVGFPATNEQYATINAKGTVKLTPNDQVPRTHVYETGLSLPNAHNTTRS